MIYLIIYLLGSLASFGMYFLYSQELKIKYPNYTGDLYSIVECILSSWLGFIFFLYLYFEES